MQIDRELDQMKQELTLMAREAETIFDMAIEVMKTRDEKLSREVIQADRKLDQLEISMDHRCMRLLTLNDPYAIDLRFVYSVIKTIKDLERVGDESKSIVRWCGRLKGVADPELLNLAEKSREALTVAIRSLVNLDAEQARTVLDIEIQVDEIEDRIIEESASIPRAFVARSLERISDMCTNIAENVIFSVQARDIRHGGIEDHE